MLRRKHMPERLRVSWEAFQTQAERVEQARQALLGCLPVGRVDPAPVPVGLDLLHDELTAVSGDVEAWREADVEEHWRRCAAALGQALAAVPRARDVAASTGELEDLLDAVGAVTEPLDAWHDAERAWLRLRTRS